VAVRHAERPLTQSDYTRCCINTFSSSGWAHSCSKHVEDSNKHIIEETARQVGYLPECERCSYFAHEMSLVSHTAHLTYILADVRIVAMLITAQSRKMFDWGSRPKVDENCAILGYYAVYSGISLPTFRDNLSVPSSRVKSPLWTDSSSRNVGKE